jgi:DNA mismatch repair protein MutS2
VRIVEAAGKGCLVLLDELGAGTDPTEGSALAQALLDHFIAAGALVAATTHYAELKAYAHNVAQAENASVEFDIESLSPTYRLRIGLPGTSQAFAIASRLGLPDALVEEARSRLGRAQAEFEQTLVSIKETQQTTEEALARAAEAEERARLARHEAEEERRRARRERDTLAASAREEAQRALAEVHAEISAARELLARQTLTETRLDESVARIEERLSAFDAGEAAVPEPSKPEAPQIEVGSTVRSRDGWQGTVAEIDAAGETATIAAGAMRIKVPIAELSVVAARATELPSETIRPQAHRVIPTSLDLRGARVEEALDALERYLDAASVAGAPRVTIIHGHGSGALRDALRAQLAGHPLVKTWRAGERGEGGDGATIVEL